MESDLPSRVSNITRLLRRSRCSIKKLNLGYTRRCGCAGVQHLLEEVPDLQALRLRYPDNEERWNDMIHSNPVLLNKLETLHFDLDYSYLDCANYIQFSKTIAARSQALKLVLFVYWSGVNPRHPMSKEHLLEAISLINRGV